MTWVVCILFLLDSATLTPACLSPSKEMGPQLGAQGHSALHHSAMDTCLLAEPLSSLREDPVGTFSSFSRTFDYD